MTASTGWTARWTSGAPVLFAGLSVVNLSTYVFHVVVSRLLGPAAYGAAGTVVAVAAALNIATASVQTAVTRKAVHAGPDEDPWRLQRTGTRAAALTAVAGVAGSWWVARFLHLDGTWPAIWLALAVACSTAGAVGRGWLAGRRRYRTVAVALGAGAVTRTGGAIVLAALGRGPSGVVGAVAVSEAVGSGLVLLGLRRDRPAQAGAPPLRLAPSELGLALATYFGFWALTSVDTFLVRHFRTTLESGQYVAASTLASVSLFLAVAVVGALFPRLVEAGGEHRVERGLVARWAGFVAVVLGLLAAAIEIFPRLALAVTFGPAYQGGAPVLRLLACSYGALALGYLGLHALLAAHRASAALPVAGLAAATAGILARHGSAVEVAQVITAVSAVLAGALMLLAFRATRASTVSTSPLVERLSL